MSFAFILRTKRKKWMIVLRVLWCIFMWARFMRIMRWALLGNRGLRPKLPADDDDYALICIDRVKKAIEYYFIMRVLMLLLDVERTQTGDDLFFKKWNCCSSLTLRNFNGRGESGVIFRYFNFPGTAFVFWGSLKLKGVVWNEQTVWRHKKYRQE